MSKRDNRVLNTYEKIPKQLTREAKNPNYEDHLIKANKHGAIIGSTGSGKSNLILDYIRRCAKGQGTHAHITIVTKMEEPIYEYLKTRIPSENLDIFYGIENCPLIDSDYWENKKTGLNLLVFDDMMAESTKAHEKYILPYFMRGRKKGDGIQCFYLSQSYHAIPKKIRLQCSYVFLKKIGSNKDINMIMRDQSLGLSKEALMNIYRDAIGNDITNFLTIDLVEDDDKRFRKNWLEILDANDYKD